MEKQNKTWVYVVLVIVAIGVGFLVYHLATKNKTVAVKSAIYPWQATIDKKFAETSEVALADSDFIKKIDGDLRPAIKDAVKADVKLAESTADKLVYKAKTIIVEGDADNIKNALSQKGYSDLQMSSQRDKLTAKKDGKTITITFSVTTTDESKIEVAIS